MGNLGFQEILLIFTIALIFFGPRKLPEIGKTIGKSLAEFKKATNDLRNTWEEEVRKETEGLQSAVNTSELTESFHQSSYDSYGESNYSYPPVENSDSGQGSASVPSGDDYYSGTESHSDSPGTEGHLEPNSSYQAEASPGESVAAESGLSAPDPSAAPAPEAAEGVVAER